MYWLLVVAGSDIFDRYCSFFFPRFLIHPRGRYRPQPQKSEICHKHKKMEDGGGQESPNFLGFTCMITAYE